MMTTFDPHAERPWSSEEDKQLRNAVCQEKEQSRPVKWDAIAASLPRRSKKECRKRWHHTMMEAVRKCEWKPEEDERLSGAVQKYGKNWTSVAQVVMTRNDNECMGRWNTLQNRNTNLNSTSNNMWTFEEFNRSHSTHRASVSSIASSADFHHDSSSYSTPYGSLPDPMVDEFLHEVGNISPHDTHYDSLDIDPSRLHPAPPSATIDPRQATHTDHTLDAFIDFEADRTGRTFEVRQHTPPHGQQFDPNDWSWFDTIVSQNGGHHHHEHHHSQHRHNGHPHGFLTDTHPSELSSDSPVGLDSGSSSYSSSRSGSLAPPPMQQVPNLDNMDFYSLQTSQLLSQKAPESPGAKVVIVCKSNDTRTLNSLDTIMKTLKANGHSVIQESQPVNGVPNGNDFLCGSLAIDDVLQDLC
ncbi:unnamed protein product [Tuber melanosporum]|uniref:(Perigord truffle) hypothetical protein n=1 Tax=Tuber melanosporum (strain Mel28) TaxID=656061 RepID=D5GJU8_TUBMM|nr:uncharacterized protein GSTUM_00009205001 [Tuber melanosporum]CAZ84791.1 unnamed protein product [Tuber melanosporum]